MEKETIIFDFYRTLYSPKSGKLYRGTKRLLDTLTKKNYDLVLITTQEPDRALQIDNLGLKRFFVNIVLCEKKSGALFSKFITKPESALVVGDRAKSEIEIGKKLKTRTLLVNPDRENPTVTLINFLKNYGKI